MRQKIILDTNLLLLFVVGSYDPLYITRHRRTANFTVDDYELLCVRIDGAELVFTPNVLTETSNLLWQTPEPHRTSLRALLAFLIKKLGETYILSSSIISGEEFMKLGLTDAGLLELPIVGDLILTVDLDLYIAASIKQIPAENFNHYRFTV